MKSNWNNLEGEGRDQERMKRWKSRLVVSETTGQGLKKCFEGWVLIASVGSLYNDTAFFSISLPFYL